jgi:conjugal transfer ATP-binding protein TraC
MAKKPRVETAADAQALEQSQVEEAFLKGMTTLRDLIAPSSIEIHSS